MRIIYKIKSSWDFISSQILTYLKRRWNSKMAISIKNHEDRITALEKKSTSFKIELLYSGSGQNSDTGKTITLSQPYTNFDAIVFQYCDAVDKDDWRQSTLFTRYIHDCDKNYQNSVYSYNLWYISDGRQDFQLNFRSDKKNILIPSATGTVVREVFGLKLYYNFSYNITREFYKVKFKLKHYLCSHLQKFI